MEKITVRECTPDHIERILELQTVWAKEQITIGFVPATREYLREKLGPLLIVALDNDRVIGFACATEHVSQDMAVIPEGEPYIEIDDLYVLPEYRGRKIGGRLLDRAIGIAEQKGIKRCYVYSATKDSDDILRFYRDHGFKSWCVQLYR